MKAKSLIIWAMSLALLVPVQNLMATAGENLKITHGPYLIEPGEDCMTIVWFTNKNCVSSVEYCGDDNHGTFPTWGGYPDTARSSAYGLINANSKRHAIRLTNLEPGRKYRYRIVSKEIIQYDPYEVIFGDTKVGDICEFETLSPDKESFSFGVVTDLHEQPSVLDALLKVNPVDSMDLMFFTGDMLNWLGSEERIFDGFLDVSVEHFATRIPMIMIRGNHETRGPNSRELIKYFPHSSGKFYYAFSHGDTRFVIMDSGEDKPDTHPVYGGLVDFDQYRTEQTEWLKKEVESEEFIGSTHKIILFHIPPFSDRNKHGADDITDKWGPILNEANIDILICGHHHIFDRIEKKEGKNNFPILILGRGMILQTDVSKEMLHFSIMDTNGDKVDEFEILK